jgi:3-isopropylmalate/(R)-2-methylmalate dehydratase small subunit
VAGRNFGCAARASIAVWALGLWFRAVISTGLADIFKRNAIKNGLVPVVIDAASHAARSACRAKRRGRSREAHVAAAAAERASLEPFALLPDEGRRLTFLLARRRDS